MGLIKQAHSIQLKYTNKPELDFSKRGTDLFEEQQVLNDSITSEYDILNVCFNNFIKNTQFEKIALLSSNSDLIIPILGHGFDLTTLRRFIINKPSFSLFFTDSIDHVLFLDKRKDFFKNNFSTKDWASIQSICIYKMSNSEHSQLYILCVHSFQDLNKKNHYDEYIKTEILKLSNSLARLDSIIYYLSFNESLNSSVDFLSTKIHELVFFEKNIVCFTINLSPLFENQDALFVNFNEQNLHSAMVNYFVQKIGKSNIMYLNNTHSLRIIVTTTQFLDIDLYKMILFSDFENIFGKKNSSKIVFSVSNPDKSSVAELKKFLFGS